MPLPSFTTPAPSPADALERLIRLRWLSLAVMALVLVALPGLLDIPLPGPALLPLMIAFAAFNVAALLRLRRLAAEARNEIRGVELFLQLCVDLAAWSAFLYFTGGATNPLISLLLPLVAIGAASLPPLYAALLGLLAVLAYGLLWEFNEQLDIYDSGLAVHWHLAGMGLTFALSALVIVGYVTRMTALIRSRDQALAEARESRLRNERIVALGNLAAGAAHELGTPLGTMAILAGELLRSPALDEEARADMQLLQAQIGHCKRILGGLTQRAGSPRAEGATVLPADAWLEAIGRRWRKLRPHVPLALEIALGTPAPSLVADTTLEQALHNLINNAADASPAGVECTASVAGETLVVRVLDRGPGMPAGPEVPPGSGLGIGLLLAVGAVERCGGHIGFAPRPGGGTIATLSLPLSALRP